MEMKKKLIFFFNSLYFEFEEAIVKSKFRGRGTLVVVRTFYICPRICILCIELYTEENL